MHKVFDVFCLSVVSMIVVHMVVSYDLDIHIVSGLPHWHSGFPSASEVTLNGMGESNWYQNTAKQEPCA